MKLYTLIVMFIATACGIKSSDDQNKISHSKEQIYEITPTLSYMKLNEIQLAENTKMAKIGDKTSIDKLIDHYLFIGEINNYSMWCHEGARVETVKGLYCVAGLEYEKGGYENCIRVIALYKKISSKVSDIESKTYAQTLGLNISGIDVSCQEKFWSIKH